MKRLTLILLALLLALLLTACGCRHEETNVDGYVDATCTQEGYTGDTVCTKCGETVAKGEAIPAVGHAAGEPEGVQEATCTQEGYTGDVCCTACGERLTTGEGVPMADHTPAGRKGIEPTCSAEGATGALLCAVCGECLEESEAIPMLPHTPAQERSGATDASCLEDGYTGDILCTVCGQVVEAGEAVPAAGHSAGEYAGGREPTCLLPGYQGDATCTVCGEPLCGEVIPRLEHVWEGDVCTVCGWRAPGLYVAGVRRFTWEELVAQGLVTVEEREDGAQTVVDCDGALSGELVLGEQVAELGSGAFSGSQLQVVWVDAGCAVLGMQAFSSCPSLREAVFFGPAGALPFQMFYNCPSLERVVLPEGLTEIGDSAFQSCPRLVEIELPESVTVLGQYAFNGCESLPRINLPDGIAELRRMTFYGNKALTAVELPASLTLLGESAFAGCEGLTELTLPEGLATVESSVLRNTAVTHLTIPASVTELRAQADTDSLVSVDMSAMTIAEFTVSDFLFSGCDALEEIILPAKLLKFRDWHFEGNPRLKSLVLPETLMSVEDNGRFWKNEQLTELVWPAMLSDGSAFASLPNLATIYYCGSEEQWSMTLSRELFADVDVVFDYVPQASAPAAGEPEILTAGADGGVLAEVRPAPGYELTRVEKDLSGQKEYFMYAPVGEGAAHGYYVIPGDGEYDELVCRSADRMQAFVDECFYMSEPVAESVDGKSIAYYLMEYALNVSDDVNAEVLRFEQDLNLYIDSAVDGRCILVSVANQGDDESAFGDREALIALGREAVRAITLGGE